MNEPKARQPRRRSMRHPTFRYAEPGSYFVPFCVEGRRRALGEVTDGEMFPSPAGRLAESCQTNLEARFPTTLVDCFVVMPNHDHAVIVLGAREPTAPEEGAMNRAATRSLVGRSHPKLGELVRVFNAMSARLVRTNVMPEFAWQSDYHDRIIRNDRELAAIRDYVEHNPARWDADTFSGE